jgi:2'-hydroxyisoflavone reductase
VTAASQLRVLVLGGTSFVGRHIVEALLARGHDVTLFNRGRSAPDLFAEADHRTGDRDSGDYGSLSTGTWDAVVDVSAYVPRHVREATAALDGRASRYLFISTGSVYDPAGVDDGSEDATRHAPERGTEEVTNDTYGPLKVACEDDVLDAFGDRATIVRLGIVAGPHDPTDRFTYWVRRMAAGGQVLVPDRADQPVQVIDARDAGSFVVTLLQDGTSGTFNAVGPAQDVTLGELWAACAAAAGTSPDLVTVTDDFLDEHAVPALPLVLPRGAGLEGLFRRSAERARAAGLRQRPLEDTAVDTLHWDRERGAPAMERYLSPEREAEVLQTWGR